MKKKKNKYGIGNIIALILSMMGLLFVIGCLIKSCHDYNEQEKEIEEMNKKLEDYEKNHNDHLNFDRIISGNNVVALFY